MERQEALAAATRLLAGSLGPGLVHPSAGPVRLREDLVGEHELAWIVPFNSIAFLDHGDREKMCIPSVIAVPKAGTPAFFPPTYLPVRDFLDEVRESGESLAGWAPEPEPAETVAPSVHDTVLRGHLDPGTGNFLGGHTQAPGRGQR
ncbi:YrhB domain-containing protein [Amycolatopsis sp. NPDC051903]|uniref:YrhB domain-containing protein n=1 Tax=Amycolatopsis sp. NPDC051903 TaxID=3363936 RepID=UPI0037B8AF4B